MARGHHDIGGVPGAGPIDKSQHELSDWEIMADAVNQASRRERESSAPTKCGARARRWIPKLTANMNYYERWIASMETILIEKGILKKDEIDRRSSNSKKSGESHDPSGHRQIQAGRFSASA